jgi:hypothetical protein
MHLSCTTMDSSCTIHGSNDEYSRGGRPFVFTRSCAIVVFESQPDRIYVLGARHLSDQTHCRRDAIVRLRSVRERGTPPIMRRIPQFTSMSER